jgi:hypothetical protein
VNRSDYESWDQRLESDDRSDPLVDLAYQLKSLHATPEAPAKSFQNDLRERLVEQFSSTPRRRFAASKRLLAWSLALLAVVALVFLGVQVLPKGAPTVSAAQVFDKASLRLAARLGEKEVIYDQIILDWDQGSKWKRRDVVAELWRSGDGSHIRYQMYDGSDLLYFDQHDGENLWRSSYVRPVDGEVVDFVYQAPYVPELSQMKDKQLVAQLLFRDLSTFWLYIDQMVGDERSDCTDLFCVLSSLGQGWECSGERCTLNLGPVFEEQDFIVAAEVSGQSHLPDGQEVYEVRTYLPEVGDRFYTQLKFDTSSYDLVEIDDIERNELRYRIRLVERKVIDWADLPEGFFQSIPEGIEVRPWESEIPLGHKEDDLVWISSANPPQGASLSGEVSVELELGYQLTSLERAAIGLGLFWAGHDTGHPIEYEKVPIKGGEGTVQISFSVDADQLGAGTWVVQPGFSDTMGIAPHTVWNGGGRPRGIYLEYCVRCAPEP